MATAITNCGTGAVELYRSKPTKIQRDTTVFRVMVEVPKASISQGTDGNWGLPAKGTKYSSIVTGSGATWSTVAEPTLEDLEVDPRYRPGFMLVTLTFVGSALWVD